MNIRRADRKLIVLIGCPGVGKTTYCKKQLQEYERVSQDDHGRDFRNLLAVLFRQGINVVIDRCNALQYQRVEFIKLAKQNGYVVQAIWLREEETLCRERILERDDHPSIKKGDMKTACAAINTYWANFLPPTLDEGYDNIIERRGITTKK